MSTSSVEDRMSKQCGGECRTKNCKRACGSEVRTGNSKIEICRGEPKTANVLVEVKCEQAIAK